MKKSKKSIQIGLGITSILMIFVVLCMMVLSLLSYREAIQKEDVTKRQLQFQQAYLAADARMQYVLHELQFIETDGPLQNAEGVDALLSEEGITLQVEGNRYTFSTSVNEQQVLFVAVLVENKQWTIQEYILKENGE